MSRLTIIVAATTSNGIGHAARLPWRLPKEMAYFAQVTAAAPAGTANALLMGRNTWESIPAKFRPLKRRVNVVISANREYELLPPGSGAPDPPVYLHNDLNSALERVAGEGIHRSFVIGGASLYAAVLGLSASTQPAPPALLDRILLTRVLSPAFECDVFMPDFLAGGGWTRAPHAELAAWAGFAVPEGVQTENGVQYEFQMWVRAV
ncbi:hypothetical protein HWV62_6589 [Athelia sp. TMB]|nr:hypothetical protein HWV62_6589 [Athelia sp. TMB]